MAAQPTRGHSSSVNSPRGARGRQLTQPWCRPRLGPTRRPVPSSMNSHLFANRWQWACRGGRQKSATSAPNALGPERRGPIVAFMPIATRMTDAIEKLAFSKGVARAGKSSEPHSLEARVDFDAAKRISTSLRSSRDLRKHLVPISRRARSRASSWMSQRMSRAGVLGQHCILSAQTSQSNLEAR